MDQGLGQRGVFCRVRERSVMDLPRLPKHSHGHFVTSCEKRQEEVSNSGCFSGGSYVYIYIYNRHNVMIYRISD